jgi:hypothetical protein
MEPVLTNLPNQELLLLVDSGDLLIQKANKRTSIHTTTKLSKLKILLNKLLEDGKLFTILEKNSKDKKLKT